MTKLTLERKEKAISFTQHEANVLRFICADELRRLSTWSDVPISMTNTLDDPRYMEKTVASILSKLP